MEDSAAIHCINHYAHWQGTSATCDQQDSSPHPGCRQVYTEYTERCYCHQELGGVEYRSVGSGQLQWG